MADMETVSVEFNLLEHSYQTIPLEEIPLQPQDTNKIYWIHCNLHQQDQLKKIIKQLSIPEDIIKLFKKKEAVPKLVDLGEAIGMCIQCLISAEVQKHHVTHFGNLIIYLTSHYCLTASYDDISAVKDFTHSYSRAINYAKTPCFILFLLLDNIINDYSGVLLHFELAADKIDFRMHGTHEHSFNTVMQTKKEIMKIKRHIVALRDILMRISGRKISAISEQCRLSLGNLFDHSLMIVSEADAIRDVLNSTLEQIDNALMHKMSESMKVLTAFAAILLPLSLIAGIYGMNFHWMPELKWKYGYFWALFLMFLVAAVLIYIFKKKKWF